MKEVQENMPIEEYSTEDLDILGASYDVFFEKSMLQICYLKKERIISVRQSNVE